MTADRRPTDRLVRFVALSAFSFGAGTAALAITASRHTKALRGYAKEVRDESLRDVRASQNEFRTALGGLNQSSQETTRDLAQLRIEVLLLQRLAVRSGAAAVTPRWILWLSAAVVASAAVVTFVAVPAPLGHAWGILLGLAGTLFTIGWVLPATGNGADPSGAGGGSD